MTFYLRSLVSLAIRRHADHEINGQRRVCLLPPRQIHNTSHFLTPWRWSKVVARDATTKQNDLENSVMLVVDVDYYKQGILWNLT